jgi:hypothetical protein
MQSAPVIFWTGLIRIWVLMMCRNYIRIANLSGPPIAIGGVPCVLAVKS